MKKFLCDIHWFILLKTWGPVYFFPVIFTKQIENDFRITGQSSDVLLRPIGNISLSQLLPILSKVGRCFPHCTYKLLYVLFPRIWVLPCDNFADFGSQFPISLFHNMSSSHFLLWPGHFHLRHAACSITSEFTELNTFDLDFKAIVCFLRRKRAFWKQPSPFPCAYLFKYWVFFISYSLDSGIHIIGRFL